MLYPLSYERSIHASDLRIRPASQQFWRCSNAYDRGITRAVEAAASVGDRSLPRPSRPGPRYAKRGDPAAMAGSPVVRCSRRVGYQVATPVQDTTGFIAVGYVLDWSAPEPACAPSSHTLPHW